MQFSPLAFDLPPAIANNLSWIVGGLIVVVGLFVLGLSDVIRFRPRRVFAIAGVCFDESIRRRILWITPLAILGVVAVASFQKPFDEQDAIRQITKFCIFTTGLVATISAIILACTNLPREIENRVIYTIVTKPTTRLEIVLGKICGFACVSAAILLIMGVFSWGYVEIRATTLQRNIQDRIKLGSVEPISLPSLTHYADAGLLNAKTLATSSDLQVYARLPKDGDPRRYFTGDNAVLIPFVLPTNMLAITDPASMQQNKLPGMVVHLRVGYDPATTPKPVAAPPSGTGFTGPSPLISSTQAAVTPTNAPAPQITVAIYDNTQSAAVPSLTGPRPVSLDSADGTSIDIPVSVADVSTAAKFPFVYLAVLGASGQQQYWVDDHPAQLIVPVTDKPQPITIEPTDPATHDPAQAIFQGRQSTNSQQQLKGAANDDPPAAVYAYRNVHTQPDEKGNIPIELRIGIERGDEAITTDAPTHVTLQVRNHQTRQLSPITALTPENNRTAYASVPAALTTGGDFDVIVRCITPSHWIGLNQQSLVIVQAESFFILNLIKSLFILWLLTVLVISISIFSSTFVSWPIAVVLTLVILLGRWGVEQVGDAASAGLGRQFVQDFGVRDAAQAQAISSTVEQLNKLLGLVSSVLPDISQFSATDDIERGISIPASELIQPLWVVVGFGLPLTVLAYIFLKNKEVAP